MILDKIVKKKIETLNSTKFPLIDEFLMEIDNLDAVPSFYKALSKEGLSIIGEVKKASPSKGLINAFNEPEIFAKQYNDAVDAISVLTEEHFFLGSPEYLRRVKEVTTIPLLRKDFIIDENQIYEGRILGASSILLIASILEENRLKKFLKIARDIGLEPLVEVHKEEEVYKALNSGARIIGINNRNLEDFTVDLNTTMELRKLIPKDIIVVSESGIDKKEDIALLKQGDIDAVLVGESFMRCNSIFEKAKEFKEIYGN
ncbi:indole-3-glycerol phosphate synthase TrpC [Clostridium sp. DL1XJH146]